MTSAVLDGTGAAIPTLTKKRRHPRHLGLAAAALLLAAAGTWYGHDWWTVGRFIVSTDDAYVGGDITVIAPKVAGFIAEVAVTDNQAVHAGDLLVKLDDRDYKAALARATAAVAGQQATLANLDARRQLQQAMIAQARAELAATAAEIVRAKYDVDRYRSLIQGQYASLQRFQQADADYKKATAADQKARAAVTAAERELDVIDTQKQQTQADLAAAIADRDTAQLNLSYTELRAPIDGVIGNRSARRGAFAPVGAQLISLVPAEGLWIDANFKESQLASMQPGLAVADRRPMCCPARSSSAMWAAWRRRPGLSSASCRRRTPPAISPRSSSACRCGSCSMTAPRSWGASAPASRSRSPSTSAARGTQSEHARRPEPGACAGAEGAGSKASR